MRRHRLSAFEGDEVHVPAPLYESLAREGERLARELDLNFGGVTRLAGRLRFDNMIGTISTRQSVLEVAPKTRPGEDWIPAVLDLMGGHAAALSGEVSASESAKTRGLLSLLSLIYTRRLGEALSAEGPLTTIESRAERSSMLTGRLRVEEWALRAAYEGHVFPVDRQHLTIQNAYARTLGYVGQLLAPHLDEPRARRQLAESVDALTDGREIESSPANASHLDLPEQWRAYESAWAIAQMILRRTSRFGTRPQAHGLSFVIEPWQLLEELLERTVQALAVDLTRGGILHVARAQNDTAFLVQIETEGAKGRHVHLRPDCVLYREGSPVISFEAKYRDYARTGGPRREESYQAITAARALGTKLAVLIYPNGIETRVFEVRTPANAPRHLAVVGLDLFAYRRGAGEVESAQKLKTSLENVIGTDIFGMGERTL